MSPCPTRSARAARIVLRQTSKWAANLSSAGRRVCGGQSPRWISSRMPRIARVRGVSSKATCSTGDFIAVSADNWIRCSYKYHTLHTDCKHNITSLCNTSGRRRIGRLIRRPGNCPGVWRGSAPESCRSRTPATRAVPDRRGSRRWDTAPHRRCPRPNESKVALIAVCFRMRSTSRSR